MSMFLAVNTSNTEWSLILTVLTSNDIYLRSFLSIHDASTMRRVIQYELQRLNFNEDDTYPGKLNKTKNTKCLPFTVKFTVDT